MIRLADETLQLVSVLVMSRFRGLVLKTKTERMWQPRYAAWFTRFHAVEILPCFGSLQIPELPQCSFFAVYDGHGGVLTAEFLQRHLRNRIVRNIQSQKQSAASESSKLDIKGILKRSFEECNAEMEERIGADQDGSTAVVCMVYEGKVWIAWVGDSIAIACDRVSGEAIELVKAHTPLTERLQIQANNGKVEGGRVQGLLGVGRALGYRNSRILSVSR